MINFGNFSIGNIFLGNTQYGKVYNGNDLVWEKTSPGQQVIYGVKLDRTLNNNAPLGASWATYTDDAVGFSEAYMDFANNTFVDNGWLNRFPFNQIKPCLFKNGAVVGYLNPNDYTKFADGTSAPTNDTTAGDVMIEIPKIYYKISSDNQYNYIQISDQPFTGSCCLGHVYKGQELSKIYVDAYLTPGNDLATIGPRSIKGITVAPSGWACGYQRIYDGMKDFRGSRCEPFTFNIFTLLGCLSAILFKSTNVRTSLGVGLSSQSGGMVTGDLDANGMYFGTNTEGRTKLFGFEDYYGTKFTYCAGFWLEYNTGNLKIIDPYNAVQNYNYDENDLNSLWSYATYTPPETWQKPTAGTSTYIPVRLAGINKLGFTRVQETGTNVSQSNDVGFCSKTRFRNTIRYILGCVSSYFGDGGGVYNYDAYNFADTTRRAFRCVYFPVEQEEHDDFIWAGNTIVEYTGSSANVTVPSNATAILDNAFKDNTTITSITLPSSVSTIGNYAFSGCTNLANINLSNVIYIGEYAFQDCSSLTNISLTNINTVNQSAFRNCTGIITINLGNNTNYIGSLAFSGCNNLTSVTINAITPPTLANSNAFDSINNYPIYVPSASVNDYQSETNWSSLATRIQAITE